MNFYDFTLEELESYLIENGFKKYNATQIIEWVYEKHIYDFDKMTNLSKKLIEFLKLNISFDKLKVIKVEESDLANKYLLELKDGNRIESVLMKHDYGLSLCVSSQIGCNMGCSFCESGRLKKIRNLTLSEIVMQVTTVSEYENKRIDSIVMMGIGEPFDNYDNVMDFVRIINNQKALAIGARHITVSTCGIPDKIVKYGQEGLQINLAISLHAPNNILRNKLMKINKAYPLEVLIPAVAEYIKLSSRRVTYEYIMLKDINDSLDHAKELVELIKPTYAYVNLIPYNQVDENGYKRADNSRVHAFMDYLMKHGVTTTIRKEFGSDIDAACGQLRAKEQRG